MLKDFTKEKFDIIIQAGQSNSEGFSCGNVEKPYEPDGRIWYLDSDFTLTLAKELVINNGVRGNFALSFAKDYLDGGCLEEGRKLLIIRAAVGGAGFLDHHWGPEDDLYLRLLDLIRTALELNPENRLVALLWHQGETDALMHADYDTHYGHFAGLVNGIRSTFCVPELPFVAGEFVREWIEANQEICEPVLRAIRDVCRDLGGRYVETDGLISNFADGVVPHPFGFEGDNLHFCRSAIYELGHRYFDAWKSMEK